MIIFDEKEHAKKMIKKGFVTKKYVGRELGALAKYYHSIGEDMYTIKQDLIKFCKKNVDYFELSDWRSVINSAVDLAKHNKLKTGIKVIITKNELDKIQQLDSLNEQKVAFVLLVLNKFFDKKRFEVFDSDIFRFAKINTNAKQKELIIHNLIEKKYIQVLMNEEYSVLFQDESNTSTPEITISQFDDFIYEYLNYIGDGRYSHCVKCGKIIKLTSNRKQYCRECWKEKQLQWQRNSMRKTRSRNVK